MKTFSLNFFVTFLLLFFGCAQRDYYFRGYELNKEKTVTVGSVMIEWQYGIIEGKNMVIDLRRQLIYTGIDHDVVQITYREFSSNVARPAFYQQLKYDISRDKNITFQDIALNVVKADQSEISYVLVKEPEVMRGSSSISSSSNPCLDSLYLVLKKKQSVYMTKSEVEYFQKKDEECEGYKRVIR